MRIKPFKALRPIKNIVEDLVAPPYDVINYKEAIKIAGPKSILHLSRPDIDLSPSLKSSDPQLYKKAAENLNLWKERSWLREDSEPSYYIYSQKMGDRTQYGIVLCVHVAEYLDGNIKKHEFTRQDKEDDRLELMRKQNAHLEPVFLAYKDNEDINSLVDSCVQKKADLHFVDTKGFSHDFWTIDNREIIENK